MKCQLCNRKEAVLKASFCGAIVKVCADCVLVFDDLIPMEVLSVEERQEGEDGLEVGNQENAEL